MTVDVVIPAFGRLELLGEAIKRIAEERSVSSLWD